MLKNVLTTTVMLIGAVIGAGFATGREIAVYFGNCSLFSAMLSGVLLGAAITLFLVIGRQKATLPFRAFFNRAIDVSLLIVFCAMCSALNMLSSHGAVTVVLCLLAMLYLTPYPLEFIKKVNFILVLLIVFVMVYFVVVCETKPSIKPFSATAPLNYAAMNLLLCCRLAEVMGAKLSKEEIAYVGVSVGLLFSLLLGVAYVLVQPYALLPMPMLSFALNYGLGDAYRVVVYLAVLTTLLATLKLLYISAEGRGETDGAERSKRTCGRQGKGQGDLVDKESEKQACHPLCGSWNTKNNSYAKRQIIGLQARFVILLCAVGCIATRLSFALLVRLFYPFISALGIVQLCLGVYSIAEIWTKRSKNPVKTRSKPVNEIKNT